MFFGDLEVYQDPKWTCSADRSDCSIWHGHWYGPKHAWRPPITNCGPPIDLCVPRINLYDFHKVDQTTGRHLAYHEYSAWLRFVLIAWDWHELQLDCSDCSASVIHLAYPQICFSMTKQIQSKNAGSESMGHRGPAAHTKKLVATASTQRLSAIHHAPDFPR